MKRLQQRLRAIFAEYAAIKAKRERTDSDKRIAMMQTLNAVIEQLETAPAYNAADTVLLFKLVDFLYDAETGHRTSWAIPKTGHRPKGQQLGYLGRRAVAAAEMQKLIDGGMLRKDAALAIRRKCAPGLLGDSDSELIVARWREWIMEGPSDSPDRQIYDATLKKE